VSRRKSDGRWQATVTLPDGRRRWAYARTRREAVAKRAEMLAQIAVGLEPAPTLTVGAFLDRYLDSAALRVRPSTLKSYRQTVYGPRATISRPTNGSIGLIPGLGHLKLARLTVPDVERYLAGLIEGGARGHTPIRHRAVLSAALSDAMRWGLVGRNVASLARMPSVAAARTPHALTLDDARRLIEGTRGDRLAALWVVFLYLGLRESEALGLGWDDVDLDRESQHATLTVRFQLGRRDGEWVRTPPKTASGTRTIALYGPVVDALREHRRRMAEERTPSWEYHGLCFVTEAGRPLYGWRILQMLYGHEDRLGIPRATVHDLRHSAASIALASGLGLEDVRDLLGHSSVAITSRTYGHVMAERQREVARRMADTLGD
jgi:integrase